MEFLVGISFLIGILAGAFSGFMGGAAGTIAVPLFLLLGLSPYSAVTTTKAGGLGIALGSIAKFWRTDFALWSEVRILIPIAIVAAILGANALMLVPQWIVTKIVAVLLLVSATSLYLGDKDGIVQKKRSPFTRIAGYFTYFITEGFRAAFGSGFGMLTKISLVKFLGMTMLESVATSRIAGVLVTLIAFIVFFSQGLINIFAGVGMFFGCVIGSYVGSHYAIKVGNSWIKSLFIVYAIAMATVLFVTGDISLLG